MFTLRAGMDDVEFIPSTVSKELIIKKTKDKEYGKTKVITGSLRSYLGNLFQLSLSDCGITSIDNLHYCENLRVVYLDNNGITSMEGLENLENLRQLHLRNNRISSIGDSLSNLKMLEKLYLDNNCISVVEGLSNLHHLEELYISNQQLEDGKFLRFDANSFSIIGQHLSVLVASNSRIIDVKPLKLCTALSKLALEKNDIDDIESIKEILKANYHLEEFTILGNPLCKAAKYRDELILNSNISLITLDGISVTRNERKFLKNFEIHKRHISSAKTDALLSETKDNNQTYTRFSEDLNQTVKSTQKFISSNAKYMLSKKASGHKADYKTGTSKGNQKSAGSNFDSSNLLTVTKVKAHKQSGKGNITKK